MDTLLRILAIGIGATALVDAWALARRSWLGIALPDYAFVGRWIAHMRRGRFHHAAIAKATPVRGERVLGWTAHYGIGIAFAALVPTTSGVAWLREPTLLPALLVGVATVAAPLLLMQPGMGAGLAARKTPRPAAARLQSVVTHALFGLALYLTALVLAIAR